jgi:hypothetical protein
MRFYTINTILSCKSDKAWMYNRRGIQKQRRSFRNVLVGIGLQVLQ